MILDTSAVVAILYREPEAEEFTQRIRQSATVRMSVASHVELALVVGGLLGPEAVRDGDDFLWRAGVRLEPVTAEQGELARQAFFTFGKGRHRAALNFGDCFSYALAKALGERLLFKGRDFSQTDIVAA